MREEIEKVLSEEVRPMLSMHGGDIELVEVTDDNIVKVRLKGGCSGCPASRMTLTDLVEKAIKSRFPQIKKVESV